MSIIVASVYLKYIMGSGNLSEVVCGVWFGVSVWGRVVVGSGYSRGVSIML